MTEFGLERFLKQFPPALKDARLALLTNHAAVDRGLRQNVDLLRQQPFARLECLFSPQHGMFGEQQDNMIETEHSEFRGLNVFSLYSETRKPSLAMLAETDVLLVDLQDVGCRVYTYLWTVAACLSVCAELGIEVWILDRPNPLGAVPVEGALLNQEFQSFVGGAPLPMHHGLTLAEAALAVNDLLQYKATVQPVRMSGWCRRDGFPDRDRPWIPPSPNLPRIEGVLLYPGQVLFEGTNLSEGRGTTTPFEICGAPFIDGRRWLQRIRELGGLNGVSAREHRFEPTFSKWQGLSCGGLFLHPRSTHELTPYRNSLRMLLAAKQLWPERFEFKPPPYEYETRRLPFDCITGDDKARRWLENDGDCGPLTLEKLCDPGDWWRRCHACRLYPEPDQPQGNS